MSRQPKEPEVVLVLEGRVPNCLAFPFFSLPACMQFTSLPSSNGGGPSGVSFPGACVRLGIIASGGDPGVSFPGACKVDSGTVVTATLLPSMAAARSSQEANGAEPGSHVWVYCFPVAQRQGCVLIN